MFVPRLIAMLVLMFALLPSASGTPRAKPPASPTPPPGQWFEARYEGTLDYEAHFKRPGETRRYHSRQRFLTNGRDAVRLDWTTWADGDSAGDPESHLIVGDAAFHRDAPDQPWRARAGDRAAFGRLQAEAAFPWMLARKPRLPALVVARTAGRIDSIVDPRAHRRLGDTRNAIRYRSDEAPEPAGFSMALYEDGDSWTLDARRTSWTTIPAEDSLLAAPVSFTADPVDTVDAPTLRPLAAGLWAVDLEHADSRSLVVEFADHLAVIEMPDGSAIGERMVDLLRRRWPRKPIRDAFFSHYHPHYAGGLRAFVAAGATIVVTKGNEAFVRQMVARPFRIAPDRLARAPRPLELRTFQGRLELADSTNRLVAVDIGARSTHTDEFLIFWLPTARLVFEAEQGWLTAGGALRASRRAEEFLRVLADERLEADRLVQSWPMRGNRAEVSTAELDSLVQARRRATP